MAEIKKTKTRMYDPWGYQEENNYDSSENQFEIELNALFASAAYNDNDKKIHFFNNDGNEISGSSIDTTEFAPGVIEEAYYDPTTKELVIVFDGGSVVRINMAEIIDEHEFGNGLQVDSEGIVSIKLDGSSDPYLSVGSDGIKLSGVESAINNEKERAIDAENSLQESINNEIARATSAETILDSKIETEKTRAEEAEAELQAAIEAEIARATSAETDLQTAIEIEKQRAEDAESTLNDKIDHEIVDRIADVEAEEIRAKAAESALTDALNAEIVRSTREDEAHDDELRVLDSRVDLLNSKVDNEIARATSAETVLNDKINAEETRAKAAEETLGNALDLLNQKLGYKDNETLQKNCEHEVAFGSYNISNTGATPADRTLFSVGNGTADNARSNALEIRENGDVYMWVEGDFMKINDLLAMLAHEVY